MKKKLVLCTLAVVILGGSLSRRISKNVFILTLL